MAENQNQQGSPSEQSGGSGRGFASMDDQKQREAAGKGGSSVPPQERSFSKDRKLAAEAGREGGESSGGQHGERGKSGEESSRSGGNPAEDREKASEADRKGGQH